jgi:TPR repeat protein
MHASRPTDDRYDEAARAADRGDFGQALRIYESLAKDGHVYSLVLLAHMHVEGQGTAVDLSKAEELLDQAARLGMPEAALQKANIWLARGDMRRYFFAIQQAAQMGLLTAQYRLGLCYAYGRGTARNAEKALEVIREAADRGQVRAKGYIARRLLARPLNPLGFMRGLVLILAALIEILRIGLRNPHDDRVR